MRPSPPLFAQRWTISRPSRLDLSRPVVPRARVPVRSPVRASVVTRTSFPLRASFVTRPLRSPLGASVVTRADVPVGTAIVTRVCLPLRSPLRASIFKVGRRDDGRAGPRGRPGRPFGLAVMVGARAARPTRAGGRSCPAPLLDVGLGGRLFVATRLVRVGCRRLVVEHFYDLVESDSQRRAEERTNP